LFRLRPLANGISTDHPVPDLPFVDDSHIPVDDGRAIEAVGRNVGEGMWGRYDEDDNGAWRAFTTDPIRHDLAWCVRYSPDHGRSVLLMRDGDASPMHTEWWGDPLLFRAGGYWWDGTTWYRPAQVWDAASQTYDRRPVRSALTVSAADTLDDSADPARGRLGKVANFDPDGPAPARWLDHLALWAARRAEHGQGTEDLSRCVVKLTAPELAADQLLGVAEMAERGGIAASTLRAYISRGESSVPLPQAAVGGRSMWSRPVADDWAEQRRRSPEGVQASMAASDEDALSLGATDVRERFTREFFHALWERPDRRRRWVLRHRNEAAVREVADNLAWTVAVSLDRVIPTDALGATIRHAVLDEFAFGIELEGGTAGLKGEKEGWFSFGITHKVVRMLDWFIRHHPNHAQHTIGEIVGEAERRLNVPRQISARTLRTTLSMDGQLDATALSEYLDRVLPPDCER
jgi:hypothetical protein